MMAYGCQNLVVVVEPNTVQILQTLDRHKGYVVKVKFSLVYKSLYGLFINTILFKDNIRVLTLFAL